MKTIGEMTTGMLTVFLGLTVLAVLVSVSEVFAQSGTWETKAPMPTPRATMAVGAINGKLHVVEGFVPPHTTVHEVYDPATDTWTSAAPGLIARGGVTAGVINGKLHVVGGTNPGGVQTVHEVYNPSTNTWSFLAPMLRSRSFAVSGVSNGKLYVTGGGGGAQGCQINCFPQASLEVYDPATDTWTFLASMSTTRQAAAGGVINGKLYVAGGNDAPGTVLSSLEVYDPATDTWTLKAPMPTARSADGHTMAGAVINGKLYVIGGLDASGNFLNTVEVYDPNTDTWTTQTPMLTARSGLGADVINGLLYAVGGGNTSGVLALLEVFTPTLTVAIDIKPGSFPNSINLSSAGVVPVAILSSATFAATQVDPATVTLAGAAVKLIGKGDKFACSAQDVNGDGALDLVCHVVTAQFFIELGDSVAVLEAKTFSGQAIRGEDSINIVP